MNVVVSKIKLHYENSMKAIVSITIDDALAIHDIKIIQGKEKLLVVFPSFRDKQNKFRNIVHPITKKVRQDLDDQILAAFFIQQHKENDK